MVDVMAPYKAVLKKTEQSTITLLWLRFLSFLHYAYHFLRLPRQASAKKTDVTQIINLHTIMSTVSLFS